MNKGYLSMSNLTRQKIKEAETVEDIKQTLDYFFETADDLKVSINVQWSVIGIMFDQYRKGEL